MLGSYSMHYVPLQLKFFFQKTISLVIAFSMKVQALGVLYLAHLCAALTPPPSRSSLLLRVSSPLNIQEVVCHLILPMCTKMLSRMLDVEQNAKNMYGSS
jgi:hypothetical protein